MHKLESENTFLSFIKKNRAVIIFILIFLLGVLLLSLSRDNEKEVAASAEESRIAELCSGINGVGKCTVLLNIKEGEVISAAVLCEGADSAMVEADIKRLITSLYGIGYNKVTVLKLSE